MGKKGHKQNGASGFGESFYQGFMNTGMPLVNAEIAVAPLVGLFDPPAGLALEAIGQTEKLGLKGVKAIHDGHGGPSFKETVKTGKVVAKALKNV